MEDLTVPNPNQHPGSTTVYPKRRPENPGIRGKGLIGRLRKRRKDRKRNRITLGFQRLALFVEENGRSRIHLSRETAEKPGTPGKIRSGFRQSFGPHLGQSPPFSAETLPARRNKRPVDREQNSPHPHHGKGVGPPHPPPTPPPA